ncbi:unnamed protein product, partial [Didymodactylos carnosus]
FYAKTTRDNFSMVTTADNDSVSDQVSEDLKDADIEVKLVDSVPEANHFDVGYYLFIKSQINDDLKYSLLTNHFKPDNEIKRRQRFQIKNVIVGAIWPGKKKPDKQQICEVISRISSELKTLEQPTPYSLASYNGTCVPLSSYLIALTCDKPAQSLIQNLSEFNGPFGCGKCELEGELVLSGANDTHSIRVFPLPPKEEPLPKLRSNETYDENMMNS